jgi:hypothetical protein
VPAPAFSQPRRPQQSWIGFMSVLVVVGADDAAIDAENPACAQR